MRSIRPLFAAAAALGFGVLIGAAGAQAQTTLKTVQDRGSLICGVSQGLAGFSIKDDSCRIHGPTPSWADAAAAWR